MEQGKTDFAAFKKLILMADRSIGIRRLSSESDWEAMKQLRNKVYHLELQCISEENLIDEFDLRATIYNAYADGEIVATIRFIDSALHQMEILETHPELKPLINPNKRYIEGSRLLWYFQHIETEKRLLGCTSKSTG